MDYDTLCSGAVDRSLAVLGGFHPKPQDACPTGTETLILLGPDPRTFWETLTASEAFTTPDPVDTWSRQVIGRWACDLNAKALFPFGTPVRPFISWALRTGRCHVSPATLLVHDDQGLMLSFRGALALKERVALPPAPPNPCLTCADKPCTTACPVSALGDGYDTVACHGHLDQPNNTCMPRGCAARRACPVSKPRPDAQSAHHMRRFHR